MCLALTNLDPFPFWPRAWLTVEWAPAGFWPPSGVGRTFDLCVGASPPRDNVQQRQPESMAPRHAHISTWAGAEVVRQPHLAAGKPGFLLLGNQVRCASKMCLQPDTRALGIGLHKSQKPPSSALSFEPIPGWVLACSRIACRAGTTLGLSRPTLFVPWPCLLSTVVSGIPDVTEQVYWLCYKQQCWGLPLVVRWTSILPASARGRGFWDGNRQEGQGSPDGGNGLQVSDIFISLKQQEETN